MRALVLSGGGAKGQYQVGALQYLMRDEGAQYDFVCGVSVGALVGAYICQFPVGEEEAAIEGLTSLFSSITNKDVWKRWFPFGYLQGLWRGGVLDSSPLRKTIAANLDPERVRTSGRELRIGATSLNAGHYQIFTQEAEPFLDFVYASSAFPVAFPPIEVAGEWWSDGGIRTVTPLKSAIYSGATEVDVIMTSPPYPNPRASKNPKTVEVALRAVELMTDQIVDDDVKKALLYNRLVAAGLEPNKRDIRMRIIRPDNILLKDPFHFSPEDAVDLQAQGYRDAKASKYA